MTCVKTKGCRTHSRVGEPIDIVSVGHSVISCFQRGVLPPIVEIQVVHEYFSDGASLGLVVQKDSINLFLLLVFVMGIVFVPFVRGTIEGTFRNIRVEAVIVWYDCLDIGVETSFWKKLCTFINRTVLTINIRQDTVCDFFRCRFGPIST